MFNVTKGGLLKWSSQWNL